MGGVGELIFYIFLALRVITVLISALNEKKLKRMDAVEYGKPNSGFLIIAHFVYYFVTVFEGSERGAYFSDAISYTGLGLYVFSVLMLYYVIIALRHIWTVKLIIAPKEHHKLNKSFLFKYVKHPNYYLNIIPELIGIALFFHAWITLVIGGAIYLIPLIKRIKQEDAIMKKVFSDY
jgi:isoprenylcysteine carboxyl methyltransferase (ICMT) family protein YpbQ